MTMAKTVEFETMRALDGDIDTHPDHARVLAFIDAQNAASGAPTMWLALIRIFNVLADRDDEMSLTPGLQVAHGLSGAVSDLRRLGLVEQTDHGLLVTDTGRKSATDTWGKDYGRLVKDASKLLHLGGQFTSPEEPTKPNED